MGENKKMRIEKIEEYSDFLKENSGGLKVIVCTNDWSRICRNLIKNFDEFTEKHENVEFAVADMDDIQEIRRIHSVASVPTWLFFKNSVLQGEMTATAFLNLTEKLPIIQKSVNLDLFSIKISYIDYLKNSTSVTIDCKYK